MSKLNIINIYLKLLKVKQQNGYYKLVRDLVKPFILTLKQDMQNIFPKNFRKFQLKFIIKKFSLFNTRTE